MTSIVAFDQNTRRSHPISANSRASAMILRAQASSFAGNVLYAAIQRIAKHVMNPPPAGG
jgi:hypothetical protein